MRSTWFSLIIASVWAVISHSCAYKHKDADLVLHNARIHTLSNSSMVQEALAVRDGKIVEVGAERRIMNKYSASRTYDAKGQHVYPGFNDAHSHFLGYGLSLQKVDLRGTSSWGEVLERTEEHSEKMPGQGWITGRGWDQSDWKDQHFPTKNGLDSLFPDQPVLLRRVDGHAAIANGRALEIADFDKGTKIPGGSLKKKDGELTGLILDNAVDSIMSHIPEPGRDEMVRGLLRAQENCFEVGLTTVTAAGISKKEAELIDSLQEAGPLKIRVYAMISDDPRDMEYYLENGPVRKERLNIGAFKFYADGALGSRGALLLEPYMDVIEKEVFGLQLHPREYFRKWAERIAESEFQMCTHCIGDSANRMILNVYGEALDGTNDKRWRIEHAQVVHPSDMRNFRKFNIIPSVQPTHATTDMKWAEDRLGPDRIEYAYCYKELLEQNGMIALGTDFPVEEIDPMDTFYSAVARKNDKGEPDKGFLPKNSLSREEALKGMTKWAAMASFEEELKGTLEKGKVADMVVSKLDLKKAPIDKIRTMDPIIATFVGGEKVFERRVP